MNFVSRRVATIFLVAVLSFSPAAFAAQRVGRDDLGEKIIRVIKKLQRFIGTISFDDSLQPPRP